MSSAVRTSQTPNFSFQRSSTPSPYSFGKPALNCCGGSLRTLGNMNRPVAASAAAEAAVKAPQASPIQARLVRSGDMSSGSRVVAAAVAFGAVTAAFAAAPPGDAAVVVIPARFGAGTAGFGGAAGRAACPEGAVLAGAGAGAGASGFVSSAIVPRYPISFSASNAAWRTFM